MRQNLFILILLFVQTNGFSQLLEWGIQIGGSSGDYAASLSVGQDGSVYSTGSFSSTADFNPGEGIFNLTSNGGTDTYVSKHSGEGDLLWALSFGSSENGSIEHGNSIVTDAQGNVYVTGQFSGTVDFDPGVNESVMASAGGVDVFFCKFDTNGNFLWSRRIGSSNADEGIELALDPLSGDVVLAGMFQGAVDFDPGVQVVTLQSQALSHPDIFFCRFDPNGNLIWAKNVGGFYGDTFSAMALDENGNIYATGGFIFTADFDPSPNNYNLTSSSTHNVFLLKLTSNGDFVWATSFGGTFNDMGNSIALGSSGDLYVGGFFAGEVDFDPTVSQVVLSTSGQDNAFVSKFDYNGNFIWVRHIVGQDDSEVTTLDVDSDGNIFIAGNLSGAADFDPNGGVLNLTSSGGDDAFLTKWSSDGNFHWASKIGGSNGDNVSHMMIDQYGQLHLSGSFSDIVDFDPGFETQNFSSAGLGDAFIMKLNSGGCSPSSSALFVTECDDYAAPSGLVYTQSGSFVDVIANTMGCDSLINIDLVVNHSSSSYLEVRECDFFELNGIEYVESGQFEQILINESGCDSVITLDLIIDHIDISIEISGNELTAHQENADYLWLDCNDDFAEIPSATMQSYMASESGSYAVEVTVGECVERSECETILVSSVIANGVEGFGVYPNPTSDYLHITPEVADDVSAYFVLDCGGHTLQIEVISGPRGQVLDTRSLANGVYTLQVILNDGRSVVERFVKM